LPRNDVPSNASSTLETLFEVSEKTDANELAILEATKMIEKAKMPLLLIGAGANRQRTSDALTQFVESTGIPFFNTQMGKGVLDERHAKFLGTAALSSNDFLHCAIIRADLIINVGHDVVEKPPFSMEEGGTKVIHVNFFPAQVDEVYFPQLNVIGDIASSITHLTNHIQDKSNWDFSYYGRRKEEVKVICLNIQKTNVSLFCPND
jgi:acetolactate synthase-1/2/3 large subunit